MESHNPDREPLPEKRLDEGMKAAFATGSSSPREDRSVLKFIQEAHGAAPKVLLREVASEHEVAPVLGMGSPELKEFPEGRGNYQVLGELACGDF